MNTTDRTDRNVPHCQNCGNPNPAHDQGYTACCNERIVFAFEGAAGTVDCTESGCFFHSEKD